MLSPSKPEKEQFLYLVISPVTVSAALVKEDDGVQKPIYFTSQALLEAEERYSQMEKLTFALVTAHKNSSFISKHTL